MTAAELIGELRRRGLGIAVAESLTGGALSSALVEVPGASAVHRGGVVSYATELKHRLLGVDADLLAMAGPVHPEVALQMARGAAARLRAEGQLTLGLSTTGVAGPDPQGSAAVGTVFVAAVLGEAEVVRKYRFDGDRAAIRGASVDSALALGRELLARTA
ncbi:CinA family protein [Rathayibacter iranicus]|uniref:CinA family protein n=2 Tax=Rathayibacter iranicus TaxID=59737 RepID=A0AAD1AAL8_9MICO|nr:CinA family protein [Rathayibacter iranicus]AZZ54741.1 CinA family protein [Rathayibacter iranicus]MWV30533.1 nicotinamide-nucleotide amidohydrolase family protein [Rathayibacter iranicus NCPPB 2253 = VKM Ac-1602]PPI50998.1 competence protein [Rathayibacter iranicus]PPI62938.1 competence protein [Rathayibacter iranicus]PPI74230.1 competence protein [Rathayibacter iranicus]